MTLSLVFIFLFGLVAGSFLNAIIYRLFLQEELYSDSNGRRKQGITVFKGRSFCPSCKHGLAWFDLIPLLSFALLKGQCRYCKRKISWQYPLVELVTGALFLLIFNYQFSIFNEFSILQFLKLIYLLTVTSSLIVIFVYDLKHYIIPDTPLFLAIGMTIGYTLFVWVIENWDLIRNLELGIRNLEPLLNPAGAGILASAFFFAIYAFSKGTWMGFGDAKLALLMGLVLGFPGIIVAIFFAFVVGALLSLFLIFFKKKQWKSQVPFGPFLVLGTFLALFFGAPIVNWYLSMFLPL